MFRISRSLLLLPLAAWLATFSYAQTAESRASAPKRATTTSTATGGSGTPGTVAKWITAIELGDSAIVEDSGNVGIGQPAGAITKLRVFMKPADEDAAQAIFGTLSTSHHPDGHTTGSAVAGYALNLIGGTSGVNGVSYSKQGTGVLGSATHEEGKTFGVKGKSNSVEGIGVQGEAAALSGETIGVRGESLSDAGTGVLGEASATSGLTFGVKGLNSSPTGRGVLGYATETTGVNFGVVGRTDSPNGFAGFFIGRVHVAGFLSKAAGAFKIDHPLDPENKYLSHSFVESPEMMNIYNGIVTLGSDGTAEVTLPNWFEALNRNFRYQLTSIGGFAPVYVAEKVNGNRFKIAGGQAGMEVSWQLTGVRKDAFAEHNRLTVEEMKPEGERGFYLHPEVFNKPEEKSIEWARDPERRKPTRARQDGQN
jgi:hypothetical protein